jgi:hypothetical protein
MPDKDPENPWTRFVDAAKDAGATEDDASVEAAPSGFVKRVIAMREGLWKFAKTILWRRWSLVAALLAIVLYLTLYFVMKSNPPTPDPAPTPTLPLPPEP